MTYCGEQTLVGECPGCKRAVSLKCNAWTCEGCAPQRKARLIAEVIRGNPNRFLTLTRRRDLKEKPAAAAKALAANWSRIRRSLMTRYRIKSLEFIAIFEKHKSGWPHLHIMIRGPYLDQRVISKLAIKFLKSPIVHIRSIDATRKAARYIAKYLSKDNIRFGTCKRYWKSKHYNQGKDTKWKEKHVSDLIWHKIGTNLISYAEHLEMEGWAIEWESDGSITAHKRE